MQTKIADFDSAWGEVPGAAERHARRVERTRKLVWRSLLFVPANVPKFVDKAHVRNADAIILDLEDSVPESAKADARRAVPGAYASVSRGGADVLVRINKPFEQAVLDLDSVVVPGLNGILFPKVESATEIAVLNALVLEREIAAGMQPGTVLVKVAIESARGRFNLPSIVAECVRVERVAGISYGVEDVTYELGIEATPEGWERFFGNAEVVLAAAAAGIYPFGRLGAAFDYTNLESYAASLERSMRFGFRGASCIHPAQVEPLNRCFSPPAEFVARAKETIALMQAALEAGRASAGQDGRMVDTPTMRRAEMTLERVAAIEAKEARKAAALRA